MSLRRADLDMTCSARPILSEFLAKAVASLAITYEWSDWRNGLFWWIQSVYVNEAFRRKGVFSKLYEAVKMRAKKEPNVCGVRLYVEQSNKNAQATYFALGMKESHYQMWEETFPTKEHK